MLTLGQLDGFWAGGGKVNRTFITSATQQNLSGQNLSFAGVSIGAAAPNRYVVVTVSGFSTGGAQWTGVTIGGVAATKIIGASSNIMVAQIWALLVPTGTTATIALTGPAASGTAMIGVYTMSGNAQAGAFTTGQSSADPASITLSGLPPNCAIFGSAGSSSSTTAAWTGLTRDANSTIGGATETAASAQDNIAGNFAIGCTMTGIAAITVAAAWRP